MSPEEKERRRKEHFDLTEKRRVLIEKSVAAGRSGNDVLADKLYRDALSPEKCEHGELMTHQCFECDEIHKEVFPELYATCKICCGSVDFDDLDKDGNCSYCNIDLMNSGIE